MTPRLQRIASWIFLATTVLVFAVVGILGGQVVGLWDRPTHTVTIICERSADGTAKCMSQPIRVQGER